MPRPRNAVPTLRRITATTSNRRKNAYVDAYDGPHAQRPTRVWLGHWPDDAKAPPPELMQKYALWLAQYAANGNRLSVPTDGADAIMVGELILRFIDAHEQVLPPGSLANYRSAFRSLAIFAEIRAADFGPAELRAARDHFVQSCNRPISRRYANDTVARMRRLFSWAAGEALVPPSVHAALASRGGFTRPQEGLKESTPRGVVTPRQLVAIRKHVPRAIFAAAKVLWLTGARPTEILTMRACDLDCSGQVWMYSPVKHKTQHRGRRRIIALGPRAQRVLQPFIDSRGASEYLFRPADFYRETDPPRTPPKNVHEHYIVTTLHQAVVRGCGAAGIKAWTPYQLRSTALTRVARDHGVDHAKAVAGHAKLDVLAFYDRGDAMRAADVARAAG